MHLDTPLALLAILLIPAILLLRKHLRKNASLTFSTLKNAKQVGKSLRQRLVFLPLLLRFISLTLLIVALARPQEGKERIRDFSKGVAIMMVVDRSGSMRAEMQLGSERVTRLQAVKKVFSEFISGNNLELKGRPNDLIGMISFARYSDTVCPLTLAHGALARFLEKVKLVKRRSEDGTAIGDALALAAARLRTAEEALAKQVGKQKKNYKIKSKIIILLTDGQNNAGKRKPLQAAELAKKWGIKVYTIGVGGGDTVTIQNSIFGAFKMPQMPGMSNFDDTVLKAIAEKTGGLYRKANNGESLRNIYAEIDKLERSEIESVRFLDYQEWFFPFALAALLILVLEILLRNTWLRKIP